MAGVSAFDAAENGPRGAVSHTDVPATRAGLRRIGRVDSAYFAAEPSGFVAQLADGFRMALF